MTSLPEQSRHARNGRTDAHGVGSVLSTLEPESGESAAVSASGSLAVTFWGVRGSIAVPGPGTVRYGGNTSCLEVRCGENLLIFDAGTGLRPLGMTLAGRTDIEADIFLTHTHFDHICGLPFFKPAFVPGNTLRLWAGHLQPDRTLKDAVCGMMSAPLFPVPVDVMRSRLAFNDFKAGETLEPRPGIVLKTGPLNHPNNATGYRLEYGGRVFAYITDTEHVSGKLDESILRLADGADVMVYDSMFTGGEYPTYRGWGHSTWEEGVKLADAAGVETLVAFHHDPRHDDEFLDRMAAEAEAVRPGTLFAREGLTLRP